MAMHCFIFVVLLQYLMPLKQSSEYTDQFVSVELRAFRMLQNL